MKCRIDLEHLAQDVQASHFSIIANKIASKTVWHGHQNRHGALTLYVESEHLMLVMVMFTLSISAMAAGPSGVDTDSSFL